MLVPNQRQNHAGYDRVVPFIVPGVRTKKSCAARVQTQTGKTFVAWVGIYKGELCNSISVLIVLCVCP